jgi:hypothetical protein
MKPLTTMEDLAQNNDRYRPILKYSFKPRGCKWAGPDYPWSLEMLFYVSDVKGNKSFSF